MNKKILIVEDESLVAYDLKLILTRAGYKVCGIADSVPEALEIIEEQKPEMVLLDIFLKGSLNGIDLAKVLTSKNIAFVYLSANFQESILERAKATQPYGFLVKPFREKELLITLDVAFYRHQNSIESKLRQEQALEQVFKNIVAEPINWKQKLLKIAMSIQPHVPFDYLTVTMKNDTGFPDNALSFLRTGFDEYQVIGKDELVNITKTNKAQLSQMQEDSPRITKADFYNAANFVKIWPQFPVKKLIAQFFNMQSFLGLPLLSSGGDVIHFSFYSRKTDCYTHDHLILLDRLHRLLLSTVEEIIPFDVPEPSLTRVDKLGQNQLSEKSKAAGFKDIIGKSHQMLTVLDHIGIVAPLDTSVLVLGESGTGKEQIAKSIHYLSPRKNKPLVVVNCASMPATLIESELFGHEKGAFTGAVEKRTGKFELADGGTIFLDEIGEMPAELQVKLLRVLQEQEIERIGGRGPVKINVRIVAATNRNLEKEVEEGRFRLDLYYRLFVFPIIIPPLRERKDDIPVLANHFLARYAQKIGKAVTGISANVMAQLLEYQWPGNVRELEHFIERSILLTDGPVIKDAYLPKLQGKKESPVYAEMPTDRLKTIDEHARDHILDVLKRCNGKISGKDGAASKLGLPPSTLHSKMQKLGIKKWE
ncbi:sigma 54-interacting transcriptional regulator [Mucilaginibacter gossypii]|uniref:Transcriptional regulator containing GAF, AAA-type ATPase, and DNA-binding Fis domains n=1 Tax=Mucilaginibacter gossypii TaxID=551996 RepID=A0A1G8DZC1_9SPHI|nr:MULTISPECIES: sigma 54-interacting transcriptional regulator [Mucilaginibacter]QTE37724.1 sigma 54-interacting transcriptional regulator [Mucilaginibacter gossypii]RAV54868.1 response regulator [Mucilaginibacter rubeus]SDH62977.1 Transcriptional regulator containing GAF, AAA-type ATPase, and DNA-binding Fis domains [Mucilaginibacter gossypii]